MHLVERGHFRSCDKDGGHTIRSAIPKPHVHEKSMAVYFVEAELLPVKVLHCENRDFRLFCFCDLDLDPKTYINLTRIP